MAGQRLNHHFAGIAQGRDRSRAVLRRASTARGSRCRALRPAKCAPLRADRAKSRLPRARGRTPEPDVVVTAAARHRVRHAVHIRREHHAAVVSIAAQIGEIDHHFGAVDLATRGTRGRRARGRWPAAFGRRRAGVRRAPRRRHTAWAARATRRAITGVRLAVSSIEARHVLARRARRRAPRRATPRPAPASSSAASTPAWHRSRRTFVKTRQTQ